ncbi:MAG: DUF192 domain-containing protein [Acidobacteriota bacterium]|nr:MAG: DUF192 domain-containing protein [Acidobacteriota bacterium]
MLAVTPAGRSIVLEVARTEAKRAQGLMFRDEVPEGTGMVFLFERPARHSIWMFQCRTPLDIVWLDETSTVVHVAEEVPPCRSLPCASYRPPTPASIVIEVGPGQARPLGLMPGERVLLRDLGDGWGR